MLSLFLCFLFPVLTAPLKASALESSFDLNLYSLWPQSPAPVPLPSPWNLEPLPDFLPSPIKTSKSRNPAVFVRLKLSMKTKKSLKDSLIDLGSQAGFHPDARFNPVVDGPSKKAFIWGWILPSNIKQVAKLPTVEKISFSDHKRETMSPSSQETLIVGLEVNSSVSKTLSEDLPRIVENTGFKVQKKIGYQPIPQSDKIALLFLGQIPISNIDRLLNQRNVVKVLPLMSRSKSASPSKAKSPPPSAISAVEELMFWGGAAGLLIGCCFFYLLRFIRP